ncbi:MAG: efflux RND transporter permease subunit, partial [Candidatus Omnitrophica bacterium]|nr:efflux RND transporter permease subunit [Candidatus Omnitrophota bacterium]
NDFSYYVKRRLGVLKNNGIIGFFFVLVILFLFLDPLPAFVTALGIPIALFITFLMMSVLGITINLVSMLGLIIVLGMLVDDGIIVAENVYRYVEQGMSPKEAAVKGTEEVVAPVTVTILTTCAAFAPLLFMKDIMGKFIKEIPLIVMIALSASLLEAFLILPSHLYDFVKIKKGSHHNKPHKEKIWYRKILDFYTGSLHFALNHRKKYLLGMFFILGFAIYIWTAHMKTVYFTGEGIEQFFIRVEAKKGTPLEKLNELIAPVEDLVAELPENELDSFRTYLGSIESERGFDPTAKSGTHLGQITVYLTPQQQRKRSPKDITDALRVKLDKIEGFERLYFFRPKEGPPIGRAISIGIKGEDFNVLQEIADKYYQRLKNYPGVSDAEISFNKGKHTLRIEVDENKAQQYYLTVGDIATAVRHAFRGGVATTIKPLKAEKEIDVVVRFIKSKRDDLNSFQNILIPNKFGNLIPFAAVAKVMEEDGFYDIKHLDGKRVLYVLGDVDDELATSSEVNKTLKKEFKEIERQYFGYTVKYSGEFEKGNESKANLMRSFSIAFFAIFMILATMFNSLLQPFIVMIAIPFGLIGVIFAFFAHGRPLSFFGLMGVIGLTGIVVNDSVVLVDFINRLRKEGKDRRSSLIEAGQMRLRPIIMTSVTTIGGLVAVAYGIGGGDPFLKPMALAIVWGLVFSTGLTLIGIPVIYAVLDDVAVRIFKRKQI